MMKHIRRHTLITIEPGETKLALAPGYIACNIQNNGAVSVYENDGISDQSRNVEIPAYENRPYGEFHNSEYNNHVYIYNASATEKATVLITSFYRSN